ncbi:MFS transporter [Deinococcus metallilatus]|uniref:MFS family permease n=1 Tax=Deinococcus metallilatus TaxID=1211322 RepID=A0AAJ5JXD7_9DEIO|nr:MFS transporter [Deinococcus metallilatus]MBB5295281.1 MFS family permease [Deinococcus metallilatus]QBY08562.1 MFS transporter [Deinococcus metallilatus]RXJ10824.1 MFS transporter [Deinococcus metallilatus]TLK22159.1 SLC45 family MFS transporter [Deinococcus metallilatus]GMA15056.1 MFS transporter [Deinococcus metallilatus]
MTTLSSAAPRVSPWVLSAFWFGTAFHWLLLLLILMPHDVVRFVGEGQKGTYLGVLTAVGAVMALVLPPLIGARSDRSGRRLPYIRLGVGVNLVGLAVMALAASALAGMGGFWVYVLGFLLVQFGNNYATAPYSALIPQLVPPEQRGRYSGVMGLLQAVGQLLGALTAFAVGLLKLPVLVSFALIALVLLVPALITLRGVREEGGAAVQAPRGPTLTWQQLFAYQPFLWVFVTRVLFALGQYSVQPFLQYYNADVLKQRDATTSTSIMLLCIIVGSIVSALIGGRISDRVGRKPVIYVAGTAMALAALLLLVAPSYPVALALAVFFGLGFGAFTSVDWALGSDAMPSASSYARDMGIWHVAFVAPQLSSAPQGALLDWGNAQGGNLGYTLVFGIAALFFLLGVILVRNVPEVVGRRPLTQPDGNL